MPDGQDRRLGWPPLVAAARLPRPITSQRAEVVVENRQNPHDQQNLKAGVPGATDRPDGSGVMRARCRFHARRRGGREAGRRAAPRIAHRFPSLPGVLADFTGRLNGLPSVRILLRALHQSAPAGERPFTPPGSDAAAAPRKGRDEHVSQPHARPALLVAAVAAMSSSAEAQVVYYSVMRPVVAAPVMAARRRRPTWPTTRRAGNYAAVTAYSPPVVSAPAARWR